jgi:hypothetical protein
MPQVYNLPQTVFMLSEGSNYLFSRMLPLAKLQSDISAFIGPGGTFYQTLNAAGGGYPVLIGGDWDTVWGPVVYQAPGNLGATTSCTWPTAKASTCTSLRSQAPIRLGGLP